MSGNLVDNINDKTATILIGIIGLLSFLRSINKWLVDVLTGGGLPAFTSYLQSHLIISNLNYILRRLEMK